MGLIVTAFQATAGGQQPTVSEPSIGERVDIELRSGRHIVGRVAARFRNGMYVEQPDGQVTETRYIDVREICDLDTGMSIAIPMPATVNHDTRWLKPVLLAAAGVAVIFFIRITGCFGGCHY
jgi:hypothetical protein